MSDFRNMLRRWLSIYVTRGARFQKYTKNVLVHLWILYGSPHLGRFRKLKFTETVVIYKNTITAYISVLICKCVLGLQRFAVSSIRLSRLFGNAGSFRNTVSSVVGSMVVRSHKHVLTHHLSSFLRDFYHCSSFDARRDRCYKLRKLRNHENFNAALTTSPGLYTWQSTVK